MCKPIDPPRSGPERVQYEADNALWYVGRLHKAFPAWGDDIDNVQVRRLVGHLVRISDHTDSVLNFGGFPAADELLAGTLRDLAAFSEENDIEALRGGQRRWDCPRPEFIDMHAVQSAYEAVAPAQRHLADLIILNTDKSE